MKTPIESSSAARALFLGAALLAFQPALATAGLPDAQRCEVAKLKTVAGYSACLLKAEALGVAKGASPDFTRCQSKIVSKFGKLDDTLACLVENDEADIQDRTDSYESDIAVLLSGGTLSTAACGDGAIDSGEQCDVGQLAGQTCVSRGFAGGGTLRCAPGCTFDTSGCHMTRFEDLGTTVIDHQTHLQWEKKVSASGDVHDLNNTYTWSVTPPASPTAASGTLWSSFLYTLNGIVNDTTKTTASCFENHCDWRIPTVDELKSIVVASCGSAPCIADPLLAPMQSNFYWTGSTVDLSKTGAYDVTFSTLGAASSDIKTTTHFARAVRGVVD